MGAEGFGEKVKSEMGKLEKAARRRPIEAVVKELGEKLEIRVETLRSPDRSWSASKARTLIAYLLVQRVGYGLGEVAAYLHRDIATLGTLVSRLTERMESDAKLLNNVEQLHKIVES